MQTLSSREFNQDTARAKRAANDGPVFITDRGRRAYVLLNHAEYERITRRPQSLAEALAMPGGEDIELEFELPRRRDLPRAAEFD
ncbi:MAG: type II toxin-antitoxin system Phd/YefM family antitoxin [Pseudomonadota bacterium]|nr:type II toxin-antitoxin system Phd/YefM family antitoxin [Pseudomonadota bacterium]